MRICVASQYLSAGAGGISRVARLSLQASADCGYQARGLAAADTATSDGIPENVRVYSQDRLRFVLACQRAILGSERMIYDFPGTARAHLGITHIFSPYAVWMHGIEVWEQANPKRLTRIAQARMLIANSQFTKQRAQALHGAMFKNAKVCWLGTAENEPGEISSDRRKGPPTVLIVGRLERERDKGHDALIAAWPTIVRAVPEARLQIVGNGNRAADLLASVWNSSARANIEFVGHVADGELARYFARANVFAMPSCGEGFGLVYIEAMRHSVPVIASTVDAGSEVNVDGKTGYNVNLSTKDELAERLIDLLENPDKAEAMGGNGLSRWQAEFSYSRFRSRFAPILADFAGQPIRAEMGAIKPEGGCVTPRH